MAVLRCATVDVSVRELRNHTARVIAAIEGGEPVVLTVHGRPVADIVPRRVRSERRPTELLVADLSRISELASELGAGGPGIESCLDKDGGKAPAGLLNTSALGLHTYVVTAKSRDGVVTAKSVRYMVVPAKGWKAYLYCGSLIGGCTASLLANSTAKTWQVPENQESGTIQTIAGKPTKTGFVGPSCTYVGVKTTTEYNSPTAQGHLRMRRCPRRNLVRAHQMVGVTE